MQNKLKRVLSSQDKCLVMQPEVANKIGRSPALVLQQLHYWLSNSKEYGHELEGRRWIHNSYKQWQDQLSVFSLSTIRRAFYILEEIGIVLSQKIGKRGGDQTKSYTIDYDKLATFTDKPSFNVQELPILSHSEPVEQLFKMSRATVQNEQFICRKTKNTSEKLNNKSEQTAQFHFIKLESDKSKQVEEGCKNNLILDLVEIWNQTVEEGRDPILLNKKRAQYLAAAFKQKFESSLENWKIFCEKIASSQFLMGKVKETFRATIDWVLKFEIIQRILEGDFGISKSYTAKVCPLDKSKVEVSIESGNEPPEIKNIHKTLLNRFGASTYKAWFSMASINFKEEDSVVLIMPSRFTAQYVDTHFRLDLCKIWANLEVKWG
jgi:hypothetical protein